MRDRPELKRRMSCMLLLGIGLTLAASLVLVPTRVQAGSGISAGHILFSRDGDGPFARPVKSRVAPWVIGPSDVFTYYIYFPFTARAETCQPIPGESYGTLSVPPWPDRSAEEHADLNLALRGYEPSAAFPGLLDIGGGADPGAPQLPGLFADSHTGVFNAVYQVYDWDWDCDCQADLLDDWDVTLAGLEVSPGETIHVPDSGYTIGSGYEVLVLYAGIERITLKYTREDNVIAGYTLHVENVCVEPRLLALYQAWNDAGRGQLPALRPGQAFGQARGDEIGVAIRDDGTFMDPRSRNDWWQGRY